MKSEKTITIPCKPYVKRFLNQNYGDPVNLYSVPNSFCYMFRAFLRKPVDFEPDRIVKQRGRPQVKSRHTFSVSSYNVPVEFLISEYDFYNYGFLMIPLHMQALNTSFEQSAKLFMRTCVMIDSVMTGNLAFSIRRFQDRYEYPDEVWNYDTIKKDIDRNSTRILIDFDIEIYDKIQKILLHNLSVLGTLTKNNQFSHANSIKRPKQHRGNSQNMADPEFDYQCTSF